MSDRNNTNTEGIELGHRLKAIASFIPQGSKLGDIGTDHAYLPVYLHQRKILQKSIGVDIHRGPYLSALETVRRYGLEKDIQIYLGNGLLPLRQGEVDTLSIAGMGGVTILEILRSNPSVLEDVQDLILQPQGAEDRVRRELMMAGWQLRGEAMVKEDGRIYTVMAFSRREGQGLAQIEATMQRMIQSIGIIDQMEGQDHLMQVIWQLGPLLLEAKEPLLKEVLQDSLLNLRRVLQELGKARQEEARIRGARLGEEIQIMEGIMKWLSL